MIKKFMFILFISLIVYCFFYEQISIYISTVFTKDYYKTHPKLTDKELIVASKSYTIKKLSSYEGYAGKIKEMIFYDNNHKEFVWEFYKSDYKIIISKNGAIRKVNKNLDVERTSKLYLDVYPEKYHAFHHTWQAKGKPINITKYHRKRFEWPSPCPYIGIPICNGWLWYGNAFFEVKHKDETLKFYLDTNYKVLKGYNGQVYKLSLPEKADSQVAFINVNSSTNLIERSLGWYVILPK